MKENNVWIFVGNSRATCFPSGVFSDKEKADLWIKEKRLSGVLTQYPIDIPVYDWALENGCFKPKRKDQCEPEFIANFSSASQEHSHYIDGEELG